MNARRDEILRLMQKRRLGDMAWIPARLADWNDPWTVQEHGVSYRIARGRKPAQALVLYFRR